MTGIDSSAIALKAAAVFAVMVAIAARSRPHHPFPRLGPANQVTAVRALLVALAASLIAEPVNEDIAWLLVGCSTLVVALDGVDGWLARRTRMASRFGARFDVEVDAFFILVLSILVWQHGRAGAWVLLCGLMRYGFVAAGWILPWMSGPLPPTPRGKAVAVLQMAGLTLALMPALSASTAAAVAGLTLAALIWSFALDVRRLWRSR